MRLRVCCEREINLFPSSVLRHPPTSLTLTVNEMTARPGKEFNTVVENYSRCGPTVIYEIGGGE